MKTVKQNISFLNRVKRDLSEAGVVSAGSEAEILIRHFGKTDRIDFFTGEKSLSKAQQNRIVGAGNKRSKGAPLSYLLKEAEFFGYKFFVNDQTLVPRPETEILVEQALNILNEYHPASGRPREGGDQAGPRLKHSGATAMPPLEILDIGTGCGGIAIALTLERPDIRMTALDISADALKIARKNRDSHRLDGKVELIQSDLFSLFGDEKKQFWDIIISNPPYIPEEDLMDLPREVMAEPALALDGGPGGLRAIEKILSQASYFLKQGGFLLLEIGQGQSEILAEKLAQMTVYDNVRFVKDYNGIERIVIIRRC